MDFQSVTKKLLKEFEAEEVLYALMGGFAMGVWGVPRTTVDLDFLIHRDDLIKVHGILTEMGYECRYQTENVSQFVSPLKVFGEIDVLHAFREISVGMLERAVDRKIFDGQISMKVLKVEDLIGLKVQAMANDESRKSVDLPDIEALLSLYGNTIEWSALEEYFALFDFNKLFNELRGKYGNAE
jgi:hypothetical protein